MDGMKEMLHFVLLQYEMEEEYDPEEADALCDAYESGLFAFGEACYDLFGLFMTDVLNAACMQARDHVRSTYEMVDEIADKEAAIKQAYLTASACRLMNLIQREYRCDLQQETNAVASDAVVYACLIQVVLDPSGTLCPEYHQRLRRLYQKNRDFPKRKSL